jgi:uncharacterized protein (DUF433 family)
VAERAARQNQTPEDLVEALLIEQLAPPHPYVETVQSRSGPRPMIKGSRVGVDVVVGYFQSGYMPEEIASQILPHLTLAEILDALSYYEDHPQIIDQILQASTTEAWQKRLRERIGPAAERLFGN